MTAVAATGVSIPKPRPFGAPEKRMLRTAPEMGDLELELIGPESRDSTRPWDLWGLVVTVNDIDATAVYWASSFGLQKGQCRPVVVSQQSINRRDLEWRSRS